MENQSQRLSEEEIRLIVGKAELKSEFGGVSKFYVFPVTGIDKVGNINCLRKLTDFEALRIVITNKWPGFYIPSLPSKKLISGSQSISLEIQRIELQNFLTRLSKMPHIWNSQEPQTFLRTKEADCEKTLLKMKKIHLTNILAKYEILFPSFFKNKASQAIAVKINDFAQFMKKSTGLLENLEKMVDQMYTSAKKANEKYLNIVDFMMPQYQSSIISTYKTPDKIDFALFSDSNHERLQSLKQFHKVKDSSSIVYILSQIKKQKTQIQAFEDILKVKDFFWILKNKATTKQKQLRIQGSKLQAGKQSIFQKLSSKTKQQQIKQNELNIKLTQEDEKNLNLLVEVITQIIGDCEIDKFKKIREQEYYKLIQRFCRIQMAQNEVSKKFWGQILQSIQQKNIEQGHQNHQHSHILTQKQIIEDKQIKISPVQTDAEHKNADIDKERQQLQLNQLN